ncbi:RagB/SusD family nutrient uptake outer membrane protein [termite gut metagenome]|uniref:RagB/SusD family nutrient uptake outer membrane protein n=1 Tax=termite gut metagenome TaxID=433724 RepID=A0A5J4SZN8_9ZZZZ
MKRRYLIILVGALFLLNSCSDWLDVNPRSEIRENVLLSSEDGYKNALIGAYILLAQQGLYGRDASMYIPEALSRHWTVSSNSSASFAQQLYRLSEFSYTNSNVEPLISGLWLNYYKVIVQLNDILENLETSPVVFSQNNGRIIEGEALGLRAFLHLEILRLFGPVPDIATQGELAIPYVTKMTKDPNKLVSISYSKVLEGIEKDLDAAEKLLEIDPVIRNSNDFLNNPIRSGGNLPEDKWQFYRQSRFNYYAVLGAKARFYHWIGNKAKAVDYAKKVVEAVNSDHSPKFALATEATYSTSDFYSNLVMYSEHLFGIQNPDLQSIISPLFKESSATLTQTEALLNTAYETGVNVNDIRRPSRYWETVVYQTSVRTNHFRKYSGSNQIPTNNRVPVLRLAELYLILIEDLPLEEAKPYFSAFRVSRALDISIEDPSTANETALLSRLEREYRKEFYGEGQMFFFYKKHNYTRYTWPAAFTLPAGAYVIPKPKEQLSFE